MIFYPNGNKEANVNDHISLYLAIQDTGSLPPTWEVNVDFKLFVYHQTQKKFLSIQYAADPLKRYHEAKREWGFPKLLQHEAFKDPTNGYLVNDRCIFGAEVFTGQPTKNSEDGQGYDFISKMDHQYALAGRDMRHGIPCNGSDLQNGLFRTYREFGPAHFLFTTESLSSLCKNDTGVVESDIFDYGGFKWRLCVYPKGKNTKEGVSLYLRIVETQDLLKNWEVIVTFTFFIYDQIKDRFLTVQDGTVKRFRELKKEWGFDNLISFKDFEDASNGFLVGDQCSFGTELIVIKHEGRTVEKLASKTVEKTHVVKEFDPRFVWKVENISKLAGKTIYSQPFTKGGFKWKVQVYPTGGGEGKDNSMSIFLCLAEAYNLPTSLELQTVFTIRLRDQLKSVHTEKKYTYGFSSKKTGWGTPHFIRLRNDFFKDIQNDIVVIEITFISLSPEEVAPAQ